MRTTGVRGKKVLCLFLFLPFLLSSCIGNISTRAAMRKAAPNASPARTVTSFSESLSCMDDLFLENGIKSIYISSEDIKDEAKRGKMGNGGTDMLISAISEMSSTSNAVRYVGYKSSIPDFAALNAKHVPSALVIPDYYIVGSISQADDYIVMNQQGFGAATGQIDTGYSYNDAVSVVAIDLNLFEVQTGMQMPGITSRNSLAYTRHGRSGDMGGLILKTGVSFFINFTRSEGPQQAVRTLLELSIIELMGKLTRQPYWDCLDLDITASDMYKPVAKWWAAKSEQERILEFKKILLHTGRLNPDRGDVSIDEVLASLRRFQEETGGNPDGKLSVGLFIKLKSTENKAVYHSRGAALEIVGREAEKKRRKGSFKTWRIDGGTRGFGLKSSMAVANDGSIHVVYFDPLKRSLMYAKKSDAGWSTEAIDGSLEGADTKDISVHVAVDRESKPHVLYSFKPGYGGSVIRYASLGKVWNKEMIEMFSAPESGVRDTYIFFSEKEEVNLLYSGAHLTHVKKKGKRWIASESFDLENYPELDLQKIFVKGGKIFFSYGKFNELIIAWDNGKERAARRLFLEEKFFNTSVLVDSKGNIHTIGFTEEGEIKHIIANKDSGTILKKESLKKIPVRGSDPSVHVWTAITPADTIHILYSFSGEAEEGRRGGLYYITAGTGGSNSFRIEAGDLVARSISVAPSGKTSFTYLDNGSGNIMFGTSSVE